MSKEGKTGQSIDPIKERVINPALAKAMLGIPNLPVDLSIIDFGTGDATSTRDLLIYFHDAGHIVRNLALIEPDQKIIGDLSDVFTSDPMSSLNVRVLMSEDRGVVSQFVNIYKGKFDLAKVQLVMHQIENPHVASYLAFTSFMALKPEGDLFVVNFHPSYLEYLDRYVPEKFRILSRDGEDMTGIYRFDSSGENPIYFREYNNLQMFLELGFDFVNLSTMNLDAVASEKPRYAQMADKGIPMFYLLHLKKRSDTGSCESGLVEKISKARNGWIDVKFIGGDEISIPGFRYWENVSPDDQLVVQEVKLPKFNAMFLNYWIINSENQIRGGQLAAKINH